MAWLRRRRQANKERMKRREFYTRELQRFWRGYCGRRDIWNAKEYARSRRPVVLWWFHFFNTTRVHLTMKWVVSFSILRPFGPNRDAPHRRDCSSCTRIKLLVFKPVIGAIRFGWRIRLVFYLLSDGCERSSRSIGETWLLRRYRPLGGVFELAERRWL